MQEVQHSSDILAKVTGALQKTNLFSGLSPDILNQLVNKATLIRFEAQDVVVTTGGPSDSFFVVIAGEVIVLKGMPDSGTELVVLVHQKPLVKWASSLASHAQRVWLRTNPAC